MQSNNRSSKDKDGDYGDYAQSFASLSLSDCGDLAPRRDSYGSSYTDPYGSAYEHKYPDDGSYSWTVQSSLAPMQSSSAVYSGTPGYGSSYPTATTTNSTGGYEYRSEHSDSGYETAAVTRSSVPSSYGGASVSGWSETHSRGTAASSVHSAYSNQDDVNNIINRPLNKQCQLPCEFSNLTGCDRVFPSRDMQNWIDHIEGHLQSKFPTRLRCWFCNEHHFDARETSNGDVRSNFNMRMQHIRNHIEYEGYRPEQMQKDGLLVRHLLDSNLIDRRTYESIIKPTTLPPLPGSRYNLRNSHSSHKARHSHRGLPQVEEKAAAESSPKHHRRKEDSMPGPGPALREGGSKRIRRNRDGIFELISAPAVVSRDDAALRPLGQLPSPLYSSLKMLENLSLEGSSTSSRRSPSKHSEDHSIGHAGSETLPKAALNEIQQIDSELLREESTCSAERIQSPQSQDHSNDGLSIYSTDTSTPESGSFWLTEYSEEEENKLDEDLIFNQFRVSAIARVIEAFNTWKETHLDQDLPSDGAGGAGKSNPAPSQSKGKGNDSGTRKRTWEDQAGISEDTADNSRPSSSQVGCRKRPQTSGQQLPFACPYTKKDPRSYGACYKYKLSRIRDVKQHLVRRHRNPLYCPVCMSIFRTEEERDGHIRERSCDSRPSIRLDGITESQRFQLAKKSAPHSTEEAQWYAVFDIVFPGHKPRPPSPYVNPELIQDITLFENLLMSDGPSVVSEVFTQRGASTWNLPDEEQERAAFLRPFFEEGFSIICEQWRARSSGSSQDSNVPSGSGSSSQNTPPSSSDPREGVGPNAVHESGAVRPVTVGSPPDGGPLAAVPEGEDIQANSADHFSFGEGSDGTFGFENGGVEFLAESNCDVDEMVRQFMDDAQANSEFRPDLG